MIPGFSRAVCLNIQQINQNGDTVSSLHLRKVISNETVEKLKTAIAARLSIPVAQQRLYYNHKCLMNANSLDYYGIGTNATIRLATNDLLDR